MSVRSRSSDLTISGTNRCSTGTVTNLGTHVVTQSNESISSVGGKSRKFKPCHHSKFVTEWNCGSYTYGSPWTCTSDNVVALAKYCGYLLYPPDSLSSVSFDMEDASARAYEAMRPSMGSDLNMTVFLLELKDLSNLFKLFDSRSGLLGNFAQGHLNYSFGWKPFIGDLKNIFDSAISWERRLSDFLKRENSPQKRHYKESPTIPSSQVGVYPIESGSDTRITCTIESLVYTATMSYCYTVPKVPMFETKVRAFLDAFGLNANFSTLWELIPFSFVVDWFTGIGDFFKSRETSWLHPTMLISDFCHSLKVTYSSVVEIRRAGSGYALVATHKTSKYDRYVGIPNIGTDVSFDPTLSTRQVMLSASLLTANSGLRRW